MQTIVLFYVDASNFCMLQRLNGTGVSRVVSRTAGASTAITGAAWSQNVRGKLFGATKNSDQVSIFNGGAAGTAAVNAPVGSAVAIHAGSTSGTAGWGGVVHRMTIWQTRLPSGFGTRITTL